jgi:hypothetical protein
MNTRAWVRYFEANAQEVLRLPVEDYRLSDDERRLIAGSIQGFQIGEASEGAHLRAGAEVFARATGNADYPKAIAFLVREENRHSAYLGRFMREQGLPFATSKWSDRIFRCVRRLAGVELSVRVLVMAEIVAPAYYDCLKEATSSANLKRICQRMVDEEERHIEFQMHHVHWMNLQGSLLRAASANVGHGLLMALMIAGVWIEHGRVLRMKHTFSSFFGRVFGAFLQAMRAGAASALAEIESAGVPEVVHAQ